MKYDFYLTTKTLTGPNFPKVLCFSEIFISFFLVSSSLKLNLGIAKSMLLLDSSDGVYDIAAVRFKAFEKTVLFPSLCVSASPSVSRVIFKIIL